MEARMKMNEQEEIHTNREAGDCAGGAARWRAGGGGVLTSRHLHGPTLNLEEEALEGTGAVFQRKEDERNRRAERLRKELRRKDRVIVEITA